MGTLNIEMAGTGTIGLIEPGWSIQENATPISPADQSGGTGAITVAAVGTRTSKFINDNETVVTHSPFSADEASLGSITGLVDQPSITPSRVNFGIVPIASLLNVERNMPPTGQQPLSEIIPTYIATVTDRLGVVYEASTDPVCIFPGWSGDVWLHLKALCTAYRLEIVQSGLNLIVRDLGSTEINYRPGSRTVITPSTRAASRKIPIRCHFTSLVSSLGGLKYNYSQNPSLETNATGWSAAVDSTLGGSGGSVSSAARVTGTSYQGAASLRIRMTDAAVPSVFSRYIHTAVNITSHTVDVSSVADGTSMSASAFVKAPPTLPDSFSIPTNVAELRVKWLNASAVVIGESGSSTIGTSASSWTRVSLEDMTKPVGAVTARMELRLRNTYINSVSSATANRDFWVDAAFFTNGSLIPYADGDSVDWAWAGTPNNSASSSLISEENDFYNAYDDGNEIYSVDVGEVAKFVIETTNYPTYLAQPIITDNPAGGVGRYHVTGSDDLPVLGAQWLAYGGSVVVGIGEIPGTIDMTLTAPTSEIPGVPGPYSLAASDGEDQYATLSIAGIGVISNIVEYEVFTGADHTKVTTDLGPLIDIPFINDPARMYSAVAWASVDAAGSVSLAGSVKTIDLEGFGVTQGSVFNYDDSRYRVSTSSIGAVGTSLSATRYVTGVEFEALWAGKTCADFEGAWNEFLPDATNADFATAPLMELS